MSDKYESDMAHTSRPTDRKWDKIPIKYMFLYIAVMAVAIAALFVLINSINGLFRSSKPLVDCLYEYTIL